MVEEILGKQAARDIFFSSMLTGLLSEKQASDIMEKDAGSAVKDIMDIVGGGFGFLGKTIKSIPPALGWTALLGASTGGLGAMAYDALKERVTHEDPEAKHHADIEAFYTGKNRELEDARWMARVRAKRDRLRREGKKMDSDTYEKEYNSLLAELDKRKETA